MPCTMTYAVGLKWCLVTEAEYRENNIPNYSRNWDVTFSTLFCNSRGSMEIWIIRKPLSLRADVAAQEADTVG